MNIVLNEKTYRLDRTHTSMPKTDGQTFSLSEPNGRLRDIPNELINMILLL
jgi:hypothetical protein